MDSEHRKLLKRKYNKKWWDKWIAVPGNRAKHNKMANERSKERYRNDPDFRQRQREKNRRSWHRWIELHRQERKEKLRRTVLVTNGKTYYGLSKRPWLGFCELCGTIAHDGTKLHYHHWSDDLNLGIWLCVRCHRFVEMVDDETHTKYLALKEQVTRQYNDKLAVS